jgi:hypothetical protein
VNSRVLSGKDFYLGAHFPDKKIEAARAVG